MNIQETKTKLERVLHTRITSAEWMFLEDRGLVHSYASGVENWQEFRDGVDDNLSAIRRFRGNDRAEQAGDLEAHTDDVDYQIENLPVDPEDRVFARYLALDALNHLRSGGSAPARATMHSTLLPCGGVDGTVPQFVWITAAELWMSAEEVARAFRAAQRTLMSVTKQPKTQARAFNVARFVWALEAASGERPPWPVMCKKWNDFPMTRPFERWQDFRTNFVRGAEATPPRYKATDEQLTEQVREATARGRAAAFDHWARRVLAATVQQPE